MKTVFSNSMLAHVWAQQTQPHGHSDSMSFDGAVAYSYREPVAHIAHTPHGSRVALFRSQRFSPTTDRHLSEYRSAVSRDIPQFTVPDIFATERTRVAQYNHTDNIAHLTEQFTKASAALMRVPCDSYRVADVPRSDDDRDGPTSAHEDLRLLADTLVEYCRIFGLLVQMLPWQMHADAAIERRDRLARDPKREAKRLASMAQRDMRAARQQAADYARNLEYIEKWRAGEYTHVHVRLTDEHGGALLRIGHSFRGGDYVHTSLGADVPIADARRVFEFWRETVGIAASFDRRRAPDPESPLFTLGLFRLDSIDGHSGTIKAGCHTIYRAEIERLALAAGWLTVGHDGNGSEVVS